MIRCLRDSWNTHFESNSATSLAVDYQVVKPLCDMLLETIKEMTIDAVCS